MLSPRVSSTGSAWRAVGVPLLRAAMLVVVLGAPLGGCSSLGALFGKDDEVAPDEPPEKLYNEGVFLLDNRHDYKGASKKFEEVERQHPYSDWARKALIMVAYSRFEAKDYDESISAARRLRTCRISVSRHHSCPVRVERCR